MGREVRGVTPEDQCDLPTLTQPGPIFCSHFLRYGLQHGAAFGLSHGLDQLAAFRPAPKDAAVQGLYFAGASTRPGNGVPLVMIGAGLTTERVLGGLMKSGRLGS